MNAWANTLVYGFAMACVAVLAYKVGYVRGRIAAYRQARRVHEQTCEAGER